MYLNSSTSFKHKIVSFMDETEGITRRRESTMARSLRTAHCSTELLAQEAEIMDVWTPALEGDNGDETDQGEKN